MSLTREKVLEHLIPKLDYCVIFIRVDATHACSTSVNANDPLLLCIACVLVWSGNIRKSFSLLDVDPIEFVLDHSQLIENGFHKTIPVGAK